MSNRRPAKARQTLWKQLNRQIWHWRGVIAIIPTVAGLVLALRCTGLLQPLEWAALDSFFQWRPPEPVDPTIVIIGINETDLQHIQQVPVPDAVLAKLLQKIKQQQPRAIGLDLYRDLPVEPGHSELNQIFATTPNLIGIEKAIGDANDPPVPPPPALERNQIGMNDIVADADGKIRRSLLIVPLENNNWIESFALKLAQLYLKAEGITPDPNAPDLTLGKARFIPFQANDGGYVRADAGGYQILINFRGPARLFHTVSLTDVLENRVPANLMRDRIVLIGATAGSLKDFFYTPYSSRWGSPPIPMAGVELQANMTSQIVSAALQGRPLIRVLPHPLEGLWILLWSGIGAILAWSLRKTYASLLGLLVAGGCLVGFCFWIFVQGGWWIPVIPAMIALLTAAALIDRYSVVQANRADP